MRAPTLADYDALPLTIDVPTAGRFFLLGREASYAAHHRGELPVPVLKVGRRLIVTKSALGEALGIGSNPPDNVDRRPARDDAGGDSRAERGHDTGPPRAIVAGESGGAR